MSQENKYLKALIINVSEDESRKWSLKPFYFENKAIATDFHTMLILDNALVDGLEYTEKTNVLDVVPLKRNLNVELDFSKFNFNKVKIEQDKICNECDGSGEVEWEYETHQKQDDCPECHGTGFEFITPKKDLVFFEIGKSQFSLEVCKKIFDTTKALKETKVFLVYQESENRCSVLKIGDCEMLAMPLYHRTDLKTIKL